MPIFTRATQYRLIATKEYVYSIPSTQKKEVIENLLTDFREVSPTGTTLIMWSFAEACQDPQEFARVYNRIIGQRALSPCHMKVVPFACKEENFFAVTLRRTKRNRPFYLPGATP
jgi:hypothetical protein